MKINLSKWCILKIILQETPLHSSCKTGNLELVKEFEEYGIDLQLKVSKYYFIFTILIALIG